MIKEIEEKASNYMRGRAMALSFKPLSLQDIKEAYLCGAEDYAHISKPINPWYKFSEKLPKEGEICLVIFKTKEGDYMNLVLSFQDGYTNNILAIEGSYEYWMPIPEIKED